MPDDSNTHYTDLQPDRKPIPIVAIGASAGGPTAMTILLQHLPVDTGLAFVYIQNLNAAYESQLVSLFSGHTTMPVKEAVHLMAVEADQLYLMPPGKDMEVVDGVLVLMPQKARLNLPIDQFFTSLANRQKDGAIGIILSGIESDGTQGLRAIKVAGGVTIAQDETAEYNSMPRSAIIQGVADLVLSPEQIAEELVRLSKNADIFKLTSETQQSIQQDTDGEELGEILTFLKSAVGADFRNYKSNTVRRRILRRMLLHKLNTLKDYLAYLRQNPLEASALYDDLLINVTSFFRDPETMTYVEKQLFPQILKARNSFDPVRIWVAGCSTGQEAFTLAMIMIEVMGDHPSNIPVQFFATDLSESAISRARIGIYTKSEVAEISDSRLKRFFEQKDGHFRINKQVRDLCVFAPHNVLSDPPFSRMDIISCRNLLIYLNDELQKKVFSIFHYALKPEGYLLLGKSESVGSSPSHFTAVEKTHKIFSRKNSTQARIIVNPGLEKNQPVVQQKVTRVKVSNLVSSDDLDKLVDNLLLAHYVPASVVVDQDLEIIQFRGATGRFLRHSQGKASLNLIKLALPPLVFELRSIVLKARQSGKPAKKESLEVKLETTIFHASIEAIPITNPANQQLFLVLFNEVIHESSVEQSSSHDLAKQNTRLQTELGALRQDMHSIIEEQEASNEELQSANEEIISSNEELQSINEELETTKEEIESANEELKITNQELLLRNDQLSESHKYSQAILSTIKEATLILDERLMVISANEAFYKIFQTNPDKTEGCLVHELGSGWLNFLGFKDLLYDVIRENKIIQEFEVSIPISKNDVRSMIIDARRVARHQKDTVLVVLEDVTGHKKAQKLLQERHQWFEDLVNNAAAMIWVSDKEGTLNFLNKAWLDYTGRNNLSQSATFFQAIHPADMEAYLASFAKHFELKKPFDFEYRLQKKNGEYHWVLESAKPMFSADGEFSGFIGSSSDIHLQKTLTQQLNHHVDERTRQLKDANNELLRTSENLQAVLDSSPASIGFFKALFDQDNQVHDFLLVVCNQKFSSGFNGTVADLIEKKASELLSQSELQSMISVYLSLKPAYREHYQELTQKWLGTALTRHDHGIAVTELDITPLKNSQFQQDDLILKLNGSFEMIESLSAMKEYVQHRGSFLRTTFHDLRGSFGIIVGATSLLEIMSTDEERAKVLDMIQRNLGQVTQMMNQLLDYSRLESGEEKMELNDFDASAMLAELCDGSKQHAKLKGIEIDFSGETDIWTQGDQVKVRRIAQNLILNAVKYTHKGSVRVRWQSLDRQNEKWKFTVSDTGPGLPASLLAKLSGLSTDADDYQDQTHEQSEDSGEGIGLFIVKRLCELLDAQIHVISNAASGTKFTVTIPKSYPV